jgi:hypothetical protein
MGDDELEEAIKILTALKSQGGALDRSGVCDLLDRLHRERSYREGLVADYHHYWALAHPKDAAAISESPEP